MSNGTANQDAAQSLEREAERLLHDDEYEAAAAKLGKASDEFGKAAAAQKTILEQARLLELAAKAKAAQARALSDAASTYVPAGRLEKASELYAEEDKRSGDIKGAAGARQRAARLYEAAAAIYWVQANATKDHEERGKLLAKEAAALDHQADQHGLAAEAFRHAISCESGKTKSAEISVWQRWRDSEEQFRKQTYGIAAREHDDAAREYGKAGEVSKKNTEVHAAETSRKNENK